MPAGVNRGFMKDILQSTTAAIRPYTGLGSDLGDGKGRCLFAGTWNADIYPPLKDHVKEGEDLHCAKNRMSGLWTPEQPLWKTLKEQKKTTVLFAGVNTDQCVLGTFVDGYNAVSRAELLHVGYICILHLLSCVVQRKCTILSRAMLTFFFPPGLELHHGR
jgi:nicotinamidase-related amidase